MDARWSRIFYGNYNNDYTTFYASPKVEAGAAIKNPVPGEAVITTPSLENYIKAECKKRGLDYRVVYAVIEVESGWQADLVGDQGESFGLMQVQPRYHAQRLKEGESLLDPKVNVRVGCEILTEIMAKYGTLDEALTVYNAGHDTGNRSYANRVYEEMR